MMKGVSQRDDKADFIEVETTRDQVKLISNKNVVSNTLYSLYGSLYNQRRNHTFLIIFL